MDKKTYSGWPGDCSPEQTKALDEFRAFVKASGHENPQFDDAYLLRFLRARKFDLKKTLEMWNNFIKWRQEENVDQIDNFVFAEKDEVKKFYPHNYFRTDKQGRPVYIERIGMLQLDKVLKNTTKERLVKHYTLSYENLMKRIFPSCSKAVGRPISQSVTILDLKGFSMSMFNQAGRDFLKIASKLGQDYYPEILGQMFVVNAPMLFTGVWTVAKTMLDQKTRDKIKILGSKYEKELFEVVDPVNLPDFLGGKATVAEYGEFLNIDSGPWVDAETAVTPAGTQTTMGGQESDEDDDKKEDFSDLKNALSGLKIGGGLAGATGATGDTIAKTGANNLPSDTPLNTQMDDEH